MVTLFLLIVFGLLLGAAVRGRMEKAGLNFNSARNRGVKWWQVRALPSSPNGVCLTYHPSLQFFLPTRQPPPPSPSAFPSRRDDDSDWNRRGTGSIGSILPSSTPRGYEVVPGDDRLP